MSGSNDWQGRIGGLKADKFGFHPVLGHADMVEIAVLPGLRDTVRFVSELKQFVHRDENLIWDSSPTAPDTVNTLVAMWIMRVVRRMTLKGQSRASMLSQEYKRGVLSCLAEQQVIIRRLAEWDVCPWELQTPGGVVDLRWGSMRPTALTDFNLNCTAVTPEDGPMPVFDGMRASGFRFAEDHEKYLRAQLGASLFGDNSMHAIRWLIGTSGSGKSSFLGSVRDCLGSYAGICNSSLIASTKELQLKTLQQGGELQVLVRARFVVTDEVQTNAHIHGVMVKQITNNDLVRIELKHQQPYTAPVRANMWVTANTMPSRIEGGDEGLARRMRIAEMNGLPMQVDTGMRDKLKAEHPQILAWLIEAAREWFFWGDDDVPAPAGSSNLVNKLTEAARVVPRWWDERWQYDPADKDTHRVYAADLWKDFAQVWWPAQEEAKARHALDLPLAEIEFYRQVAAQVRIASNGAEGVANDQMRVDGGKRRSGYYGVSRKGSQTENTGGG
jgi:putative DNA primase/helicase